MVCRPPVVRCRSKSRRVRWRGDTDKQGRDHVTPLSLVAAGALRTARRVRPGLGDAAPAQGPVRFWWLEDAQTILKCYQQPGEDLIRGHWTPGGSRTWLRIDRTIDRKARSTGSKSPARSRKTKRGFDFHQVGLGRLELPTSRLSDMSRALVGARERWNQGELAGSALVGAGQR